MPHYLSLTVSAYMSANYADSCSIRHIAQFHGRMAEGKAGKMIDPWAPYYTLRGFWLLCVEWRKKVVPHFFAYTTRNIVHN